MEIDAVEAVPVRRRLDEPFANAQKTIETREYCLVRVRATDGTLGWGECWGPIAGNREVVDEQIAPRLEGRSIDGVEAAIDALRFDLRAAYHSYTPVSALSGVDIALWDCRGKQLDTPVARLLGGARRDTVKAYATGHFWPPVDDFEAIRTAVTEEARTHVDAGFTALKQKIGLDRHPDYDLDWRDDVRLVRAVREAVGADVTLAVDANHAYDRATAERVGRRLADLECHFFEEPVEPHHTQDYRRLNRALAVPLAGGECWDDGPTFRTVLADGGVGYAQPDVTSAGGLTGAHNVVRSADDHNVQCYPHVFGSAVAVAASLQLIATVPGTPLLEFDRTPNPLRDDLPETEFDRTGDTVAIPERPGIGIRVDREVLDRYRVDVT